MHENCKRIFERHCLDYFKPGDLVLECGPGLGVPHWYEHQLMDRDGDKHWRWLTVDVNPKRKNEVTYIGTHHKYPIDGDRFDVVFCSMMLEHTPCPWLWMQEAARVCKPGGLVIVLAPFIGPQHGDDYYRFLPQGLRSLADWAGLEVVTAEVYEIEPGDWRGPDTVHADSLLVARKP